GHFSMPFFTDFGVHGAIGLLDWYTVSVAVFAAIVLAAHGATYLWLRTEGAVHDRSEACAKVLWIAAVPWFLAITVEAWVGGPELLGRAICNPLCWLGLLAVLIASIALASGLRTRQEA